MFGVLVGSTNMAAQVIQLSIFMQNLRLSLKQRRNSAAPVSHGRLLQVIRAAILLLDALVHEWLDILADPAITPAATGSALDVARLEAMGICFLCSADAETRRCAWDLLSSVRKLHVTLSAATAEGVVS
jgi:hypothetical protein